MITSPDNDRLKTIRKLARKSWRSKLGLFVAEGEDLVDAAEAEGWAPEFVLRAGEDVEPDLLAGASSLGSGSRVIGVYTQCWAEPGGDPVSVFLHGVEDPGNVGTIIRSAHALAGARVVLGPGCADPWSPKALRASMGSIFALPPARADTPAGRVVSFDAAGGLSLADADLSPPLTLALGAERAGLPPGLADAAVRIPVAADSLNVAMAATVALHETANRMAADG